MASRSQLTKLDPRDAAEQLFAAHKDERAWLDAFSEHLDRQRSVASLARTLSVWGLSQAEAARLLGISRQALGKWHQQGVPSAWKERVAELAAATDLLVHYLKRDRIPAVVRRPIPARPGTSLLDLLAKGESGAVLSTCRDMFDFSRAQA